MSQRLKHTFNRLKTQNEKALVGFVTAGDPNPAASMDILSAMCEAGLDILELGIPFSDPTADGPVIQRSSARSLSHGTYIDTVLDMTRQLRQTFEIPIVLFSYYNPILAYGISNFHREALNAGADAVLVVDLPPEESVEMFPQDTEHHLPLIHLVAPTTPPERMRRIAASATGFLYLVSMTGVTGSTGLNLSNIQTQIESIQRSAHIPVCVGFGVSTPEDAASVSAVADGVVIGSAFERLIEENLTHPDLPLLVADKVTEFKAVVKS